MARVSIVLSEFGDEVVHEGLTPLQETGWLGSARNLVFAGRDGIVVIPLTNQVLSVAITPEAEDD